MTCRLPLTLAGGAAYSADTFPLRPPPELVLEEELKRLEQRVDDLVATCRRLQEENQSLRTNRDQLLEERSTLTEKNRLARSRLESIVVRLRALEKL